MGAVPTDEVAKARTAQGLLEVARGVIAELDLDVVLDRVLESARTLTEARYAALGVLDESRTELSQFLTSGIRESARAEIGELPRGRGVLGELIAQPRALRLADVGAHPRSFGFPVGHPPMKSFLGVPIPIGEGVFGNLYLTEKAGGVQFTEADEEAARMLAELAGVAIDHARRYAGARQRRDELERTVAALEATTQFARAIGGETDLDVILELVAKRGRALVGARALLIELYRGEELLVGAGAGEVPPELIGRRVPLRDSVAGQVLRTRRTQHLDELGRARFDEYGLGGFGVQAVGGLAVPLVFQGHIYGVLLAIDRVHDGPRFSVEDQRLLEAFATSAATAVATAQSVASERQRQLVAAAEGERARWARELHDETLQSLSALQIRLVNARRMGRPDALEQAVDEAIGYLREGIADLRALITDLRPASLDELGVEAAVEALAERTRRRGIEVDVGIDLAYETNRDRDRHTPELEIALYRIVQEALNNATKHGQATRAVVEIHEDATTVHLSVRDDGVGFDPDANMSGFGLLGMRERVQLLEGALRVESEPGAGTVVRATIPGWRRASESGLQQAATERVADQLGS